MSAATEASLDDIVHSYGGIRAIKMTGDNTPSHVIDAYKELLNVRRSRGEFDESFNLSECDLATRKLIKRRFLFFTVHSQRLESRPRRPSSRASI